MDKRTRFNLLYLVFAIGVAALLQSWWGQAQTVEVIAFSDFEDLLAEAELAELRRAMSLEKAA